MCKDSCGHQICLYCNCEMEAARKEHPLRCHCRKLVEKQEYKKLKRVQKRNSDGGSTHQTRLVPNTVVRKQTMLVHQSTAPLRLLFNDLRSLPHDEVEECVGGGLLVTLQLSLETVGQAKNAKDIKSTAQEFSVVGHTWRVG